MTIRKKRPIRPGRLPPRPTSVPQVPTVADGATAQAERPAKADETTDAADDEAIRRMVEAAYT